MLNVIHTETPPKAPHFLLPSQPLSFCICSEILPFMIGGAIFLSLTSLHQEVEIYLDKPFGIARGILIERDRESCCTEENP